MKSVDINLLIDVGVGKKVENYLDEQGFSVKAIRYIDPSMTDSNIIKLAFKEERVIITMD